VRFPPTGRGREGFHQAIKEFNRLPKFIPYNPYLKKLANKLRKDMTFGEVLLRNQLKDDQFWGFDFDRQRCIDN